MAGCRVDTMAVGTWVKPSVIRTGTNSLRMQEDSAGRAGDGLKGQVVTRSAKLRLILLIAD
jgi:hypothetical protein